MQYFGLPQEVVIFLKAGKQFVYDPSECAPGIVKLKKLGELKLDEVTSIQTNLQLRRKTLTQGKMAIILCEQLIWSASVANKPADLLWYDFGIGET